MWLTKNEKRVLKLLLDNAKLSDTAIANRLQVSSQAVGRIRKHLEDEGVIKGYTLEIDYSKLGLNLAVLGEICLIQGDGPQRRVIEEKLAAYPHCVGLLRNFEEKPSHVVFSIFKDITQLNETFKVLEESKFGKHIKTTQILQVPVANILKLSHKDIIRKAVDEIGTKRSKFDVDKD